MASFEFNDKMVNELQDYYEENYYRPNYHMVNDIIRYVAAQGLDKEESIELLLALLSSTGITKEELERFFADSDDPENKILLFSNDGVHWVFTDHFEDTDLMDSNIACIADSKNAIAVNSYHSANSNNLFLYDHVLYAVAYENNGENLVDFGVNLPMILQNVANGRYKGATRAFRVDELEVL